MRLWHYEMLPVLPDAQLKGQLRELVAIMHDWRDKGRTNHLLVNRVMDYDKKELTQYFYWYAMCYEARFGVKVSQKYYEEFYNFDPSVYPPVSIKDIPKRLFENWHDKEYYRICMANLYEKYKFGKGKSKISAAEWVFLTLKYKLIFKEDYEL